ncbi:glutamate--cysteine ligase [Leuconostoc rapi]|uniref:glutamate--cysteine ligase n=1 Tax=Leuconostoc rapi TaxID=1406906 RepID=UPI00195ED485|nr:glutamate--cysteine ligase [Leuconostoc rapi]MBM7436207.1 glutamate--cysteine ligase [Leuconostoc rapi]
MDLSDLGKLILEQDLETTLMDVNMGIEVEMHRVFKNGKFTTRDFPEELGDQQQNSHIKNDFFNAQSEVITPTAGNAAESIRYLTALNHTLRASLNADELLWPLSLPPKLPTDLSTIKMAQVTAEKAQYYQGWLQRHDIRRALPTGVHVNISFNHALIDSLHAYTLTKYPTKAALQNVLFEKIIHGFVTYRWLLTYLFGAAPVAEENYYTNSTPSYPVRSLRSSRQYGLFSDYRGNYTSVSDYEQSILAAIKNHEIQNESEFHGPIRLKSTQGLQGMSQNGLDYIELRMLDLDPSSSIGIRSSTVRFIRLLIMYFVMMPDDWVESDQQLAEEMNESVALEPAKSMTQYQDLALTFMENLAQFVSDVGLSTKVKNTVRELYQRVVNPNTTLSAQLYDLIDNGSLVNYAITRAQMYQDVAIEQAAHLRVYKKSVDGQTMRAEVLKTTLFDQPWRHVEYPSEIE